jgi:hypothetical protein
MGFADWLLIIKGVLAFPKEMKALILLLQKTPSEKKDNVMQAIQSESEKLEKEGRPEW